MKDDDDDDDDDNDDDNDELFTPPPMVMTSCSEMTDFERLHGSNQLNSVLNKITTGILISVIIITMNM